MDHPSRRTFAVLSAVLCTFPPACSCTSTYRDSLWLVVQVSHTVLKQPRTSLAIARCVATVAFHVSLSSIEDSSGDMRGQFLAGDHLVLPFQGVPHRRDVVVFSNSYLFPYDKSQECFMRGACRHPGPNCRLYRLNIACMLVQIGWPCACDCDQNLVSRWEQKASRVCS